MILKVLESIKKYWGYDEFLPLQKQAMECIAEKRDSIVVLPTGGGKSLCYQAPAVSMPGMAIVVSPLISLMKDQVDALSECGVYAARLDSALDFQEREVVFQLIENQVIKLLYVSPERLTMQGFIEYLKKQEISFIAVDEAHCVSMWGHDFRPEYRRLGILKEAFPNCSIHAFTATATEKVRTDIAEQLNLENPDMIIGSFDRPNLVFKVERRNRVVNQVCSILERHKDESGIIYCIRRADVDDLCMSLQQKGYRVLPYHAGMNDIDRKRNQEAFIKEEINTIVATVAFGMGIDKSNVRYVIHTGMPKSLEHYQQESGRAGRDSLEAECCLFFSGGDYGVWQSILSDMEPESQKIAVSKLREMYDYCTGVKCRHRALLNYFGQELEKDNCAACDVCLGELDCLEDPLIPAQKILSCIKRLDERFGADYTASVLIGSREQRILDNGHDQLSTYALLSDHSKRIVRDWIEQLVAQGYARKTGEYNILQVTPKGWNVLKGNEIPRLLKPAEKKDKKSRKADIAEDSWEGVDRGLFEALRILRRDLAKERNVAAFIIFNDAALRDMARRHPSDVKHFRSVNGVGEKKCEEYGTIFLEAINGYCREHALDMNVSPSSENSNAMTPSAGIQPRSVKSAAKEKAFALFEKRISIEEIAQSIQRAMSTTYQYLEEYVDWKKVRNPEPWIEHHEFQRVQQALQEFDGNRLKPIYEWLNGEISYEKIRICVLCLRNANSE